jgi:hypothetical protein
MKRKCLAIGIILLFIGTTIIPTTAQKIEKSSSSSSRGNWLYVGGSGPGNYSTIQEALNNTQDGDTVFVYRGNYSFFFHPGDTTDYTCCAVIKHSINLIGEDKNDTIVYGPGRFDVVSIRTNHVTVSGFTIQHGGIPGTGAYGRGLDIQQRSNVTVSNIILKDNYLGIILYWDKNIVVDNISFVSNGGGIDFWDGENCTVRYCTFEHAGISHGGFPPSEAGCSLYIHHNKFLNDSSIGMDEHCDDSFGTTTIESNLFQNNSCALSISSSKGVNVVKNNFIQNTKNVALSQEAFILQFLINKRNSQNWVENYWDDWNHNGGYPIPGKMTLDIGIPFIFHFTFVLIPLPVLKIPYKEYDPNPAPQPYQIP